MSNQQSNLESSRSVKANEQRLKSLDEYEREKQKKKRLIKESLSASQNRSTHFKFDSDDEDGDGTQQPKKFTESKIQLFDDNEAPSIEEHFQAKKIPKKQKKLRDLQAQLTTTSDPRFQFSEKFLDDRDKTIGDDEEVDEGEKTTDQNQEISFEEEKKKSLAILDQITSARTAVAKPKARMVRFDPSKTEHRIYELESESKLDGNHSTTFEDSQPKSRVKQSIVVTPVMDSTRTYNFDETKLKSMFEKSSDSTSASNGVKQFQFQFFNNTETTVLPTPKPTSLPKPISNGKSKMFAHQADEASSDDENDEKTSLPEEATMQDQIINDTFFFFDIDSRLKDGLESFIRTEDLNELERTWPSKRKEIGEALRTKHRKAIQRKDKHRVFNHRHRQRQQPPPNLTSKSEAD